jgi:hypothetical protein
MHPTLELQELSGGEWHRLVGRGGIWKDYRTADGLPSLCAKSDNGTPSLLRGLRANN